MLISRTQLHADYVGLEAVDEFLAAQLCQSLGSQCEVMQHLIMALSKALRNGHSCLPLADIAGQTYWSTTADAATGIAGVPGYTFTSFETLMRALKATPLLQAMKHR